MRHRLPGRTDAPSIISCPVPQAYTRSLSYDPEGAYLASVNADGTLNVWQIEDGKSQLSRRKACPKVGWVALQQAGGLAGWWWRAQPGCPVE